MEEYPVCDIRDCPGYGTAHQPLYATPNFVADALDNAGQAEREAAWAGAGFSRRNKESAATYDCEFCHDEGGCVECDPETGWK